MRRCPFELVPAGVGLERLSFFVTLYIRGFKAGLGWAGLGWAGLSDFILFIHSFIHSLIRVG